MPDAWFSPNSDVLLGHTRLSIMDLSAAAIQPLSTADGAVRCVVNGELYDFERIRSELQAKGHRFSSRSDSEIVLHLYREYGLGCMEHLRVRVPQPSAPPRFVCFPALTTSPPPLVPAIRASSPSHCTTPRKTSS